MMQRRLGPALCCAANSYSEAGGDLGACSNSGELLAGAKLLPPSPSHPRSRRSATTGRCHCRRPCAGAAGRRPAPGAPPALAGSGISQLTPLARLYRSVVHTPLQAVTKGRCRACGQVGGPSPVPLDLDDVRAKVGEEAAAEIARHNLPEVEHLRRRVRGEGSKLPQLLCCAGQTLGAVTQGTKGSIRRDPAGSRLY